MMLLVLNRRSLLLARTSSTKWWWWYFRQVGRSDWRKLPQNSSSDLFFRTSSNCYILLLVDVMSTPFTNPLKRVNGPPADLSECRERLIRFSSYSIALLATARKSVNSSSRSFFSFAAAQHVWWCEFLRFLRAHHGVFFLLSWVRR